MDVLSVPPPLTQQVFSYFYYSIIMVGQDEWLALSTWHLVEQVPYPAGYAYIPAPLD